MNVKLWKENNQRCFAFFVDVWFSVEQNSRAFSKPSSLIVWSMWQHIAAKKYLRSHFPNDVGCDSFLFLNFGATSKIYTVLQYSTKSFMFRKALECFLCDLVALFSKFFYQRYTYCQWRNKRFEPGRGKLSWKRPGHSRGPGAPLANTQKKT